MTRPFAVITGASTGIGKELALCCVQAGFEVLIVADEPGIRDVAASLGKNATALEADLSCDAGIARLVETIGERPVDALVANAGIGRGHAFLDQPRAAVRAVIDTNVTYTILLVHEIAARMLARGSGRILIVGSIAGYLPGPFEAIYNGSKAFVNSFSLALREELRGSGVSVTCLQPGPTDTEYFRRAGLLNTRVGRSRKDDARMVARAGFDAMMKGRAFVVSGLANKLGVFIMRFLPATFLARQHRKWSEPD